MIKYLLGAILALAVIGGAFKYENHEDSLHLIVNKEEALDSVTNGVVRIYKLLEGLIAGSELADTAGIILEEN